MKAISATKVAFWGIKTKWIVQRYVHYQIAILSSRGNASSVPENHSSKPAKDPPPYDTPTNFPSVEKNQPPTGYELAFGQLASNYGFGRAMTSQHKI